MDLYCFGLKMNAPFMIKYC